MSQTEAFLASVLPRLTEADNALHNGDAGPIVDRGGSGPSGQLPPASINAFSFRRAGARGRRG
jgi:hypothetical protein